jgi:hypothetical protein
MHGFDYSYHRPYSSLDGLTQVEPANKANTGLILFFAKRTGEVAHGYVRRANSCERRPHLQNGVELNQFGRLHPYASEQMQAPRFGRSPARHPSTS